MARSNDRDRSTRRAPKDNGRRTKKKVCIFCKDNISYVDYKDVNLLRKFMSDRGKIRARRVSGNCAQHQRAVAVAIKTSRELALLPYTQRTTTERPGGRGGRGGREGGGSRGGAPYTRPSSAPAGATAGDIAAAGGDTSDLVTVADVATESVGAGE
ncbi:MAG: ribosomal protein [Acidimicrobiaceae bacterium]|jgi:small subunit ribosomal protein S18|nr:ribosomal protein [Acidimicrobiaceae bacterium]